MLRNYARHVVPRPVVVGIALLFTLGWPAQALACGMPFGANGSAVSIPSEQALIVFANQREEIITSVNLNSEKPGAAVVFPVPGVPAVDAIQNDDLFVYLAEVTQPKIVFATQQCGLQGGAGAPPGSVSVLGRDLIGGYDVARLAADDPGALQQWLDQNGYRLPAEAAPILNAYIDEGWKFVAVKLAPEQRTAGDTKPLRIAFDSTEIVYPMRLGQLASQTLDVQLYVLTDHRVAIPGMELRYAGPVASLDRPPPAGLAPLFRAPYLTKLRNERLAPSSLTADFVARPFGEDTAYREVVTYYQCSYILARFVFFVLPVLLAVGAVVGLALLVRRYVRRA
jgi:Uncharacterized protein conserved in bacteria (DUF2330)